MNSCVLARGASRFLLRAPNTSAVAIVQARQKHGGGQQQQQQHGGGQQHGGRAVALAAGAVSALAAAYTLGNERLAVMAEMDADELEVIAHENRIRQYSAPDKIFNYFSTYQVKEKKGRKAVMMSPVDFYTAITPGSSLSHGVGAGVYVEVTESDLVSGRVKLQESPLQNSVLNKIGRNGLLSYNDFCFLLGILSTPKRYIDTAFELLDVTGDGSVEIKEFAYVCNNMAHKSGGFGSYTETDQEEIVGSNSGLLNYLFGKDRKKKMNKEDYKKLQSELLNEIIELEFSEYDKGKTGRISEIDLCSFLLKNAKIPPKKKANMLKRVAKIWPSKGRGISLPSFKNFYHVLAGGADLERALFYLDVEAIGIDLEEFRKISSWISKKELSDHVAEVVFVLLDDDGDGRLNKEEVQHVLFEWRNSRGFDKGALHVNMGQIRI